MPFFLMPFFSALGQFGFQLPRSASDMCYDPSPFYRISPTSLSLHSDLGDRHEMDHGKHHSVDTVSGDDLTKLENNENPIEACTEAHNKLNRAKNGSSALHIASSRKKSPGSRSSL